VLLLPLLQQCDARHCRVKKSHLILNDRNLRVIRIRLWQYSQHRLSYVAQYGITVDLSAWFGAIYPRFSGLRGRMDNWHGYLHNP